MNKKLLSILAACSCITGTIFYAILNEWIIIVPPTFMAKAADQTKLQSHRKKVIFHYFKRNQWQQEATDLIWSADYTQAVKHLVSNWLALAYEEKLVEKLVTVQSVLLSAAEHEAFISFDSNPLPKQQSTFEKWMIIEGILKTVRENYPAVQSVWFLVRHQPLHDPHLDFATAWPLNGFLFAI